MLYPRIPNPSILHYLHQSPPISTQLNSLPTTLVHSINLTQSSSANSRLSNSNRTTSERRSATKSVIFLASRQPHINHHNVLPPPSKAALRRLATLNNIILPRSLTNVPTLLLNNTPIHTLHTITPPSRKHPIEPPLCRHACPEIRARRLQDRYLFRIHTLPRRLTRARGEECAEGRDTAKSERINAILRDPEGRRYGATASGN